MSEDSFDIGAGDVCLDFANTNDWHASDYPIETLHNYSDLVTWGKQVGLLSDEVTDRLLRLAIEQPENATRAYNLAIEVREAIYRIFSNRFVGKPIRNEDIDDLNAVVSVAMGHKQLDHSGDKFEWNWITDHDGTNIIVWKIALSAAELLTSDRISRVRQCEDNRGCGYLFIDLSKNHSRRWCSMESCGNRAKARRHYSRSKEE